VSTLKFVPSCSQLIDVDFADAGAPAPAAAADPPPPPPPPPLPPTYPSAAALSSEETEERWLRMPAPRALGSSLPGAVSVSGAAARRAYMEQGLNPVSSATTIMRRSKT
jgi:hypothetical protein